MKKIKDHSLYLVISEEHGTGRSVLDIARRAILGGVDIIQMREKSKKPRELIETGRELSNICKKSGIIFIVNDDPAVAMEVDADGVHLGQEDMIRFPVEQVRDMLGEEKLIGISARFMGEFEKANGMGVDYIALGPIFPTKIKEGHIGTADIKHTMQIAKKPVFFIGGINASNISGVLEAGGRSVAVIRAVTEAVDIEKSARELKNLLLSCGRG